MWPLLTTLFYGDKVKIIKSLYSILQFAFFYSFLEINNQKHNKYNRDRKQKIKWILQGIQLRYNATTVYGTYVLGPLSNVFFFN